MFFSEFFCPRHNVFQPGGYIFFGLYPLTYHKPLHSNGFFFILPLQICIISWPIGRPPAERRGGQGGGGPPAIARRRLLKYYKKKSGLLAMLAVDLLSKQLICDHIWNIQKKISLISNHFLWLVTTCNLQVLTSPTEISLILKTKWNSSELESRRN